MSLKTTHLFKNVNPCLKCGTEGIFVGYSSLYSSLNMFMASCLNKECDYRVNFKASNVDLPLEKIRTTWNQANPKYTDKIDQIEEQIEILKKEQNRLKKLFEKGEVA